MLGSMLVPVLTEREGIEVVVSTRSGGNGAVAFEAGRDSVDALLDAAACDWIVNAIGVLDRDIDPATPDSVSAAMEANARLPVQLAEAAGRRRIIHITTDGVFSGTSGPYNESAPHDAAGVYAHSKSLGEVTAPNVINLRCSIIGPEPSPPLSLLSWTLSQPPDATITGYVNHCWNGVSSLHLARVCVGLIKTGLPPLHSTVHLVPGDWITKADLLSLMLAAFGRTDVDVERVSASHAVDRRLATRYPDVNHQLWTAAGYPDPPRIGDMVRELARYCRITGTPSVDESG